MGDLVEQMKTNEEKAQKAWDDFFELVDPVPPAREALNDLMVVLTKNSVRKPTALGNLSVADIEGFEGYKKIGPTQKGFLKRCASLAGALANVRATEQQDAQRPIASPARQ